jgi:hypothetical protein
VYYRNLGLVDFNSYFQSVWVIVITICTVGFGDLVPFSSIGRIIIIITSFWGAFIISLVIIVCANLFNLSRNQRKAMHHLFLTRKAAASITEDLRYSLELNKFRSLTSNSSSSTTGNGRRDTELKVDSKVIEGFTGFLDYQESVEAERLRVKVLKRRMLKKLRAFKEERGQLKILKGMDNNE